MTQSPGNFVTELSYQSAPSHVEINPSYGVREATREQRQALSKRVNALNAKQGRKLSPLAEQLSQRYIAGELSITEINAQLDSYYQTGPTA